MDIHPHLSAVAPVATAVFVWLSSPEQHLMQSRALGESYH